METAGGGIRGTAQDWAALGYPTASHEGIGCRYLDWQRTDDLCGRFILSAMPFNRSACLQFIFGPRLLIDKPPLEAEFPGTIWIAHSGNRSRQRKPQAQFCAGMDNCSELQCLKEWCGAGTSGAL